MPHWLPLSLLIGLTILAYLPCVQGGFIWDDNVYVFENQLVRSPDGLRDIWLSTKSVEYYPLTYTLFWLEWRLWGLNATGYHVVNILLHLCNVLLLGLLLVRLRVPGAWWAALFFAVHPVNVETVAWISEGKNTLSLFFYLLAWLAWLRFASGGRRRGPYLLALLLFVLAALSKTTMIVLPVVLLLWSWWSRGRVTVRDLRDTAPFFVVALILGLLLVWFIPQRLGAEELARYPGLGRTLLESGLNTWFYLGKALLPVGLCLVYPPWGFGGLAVAGIVSLLTLAGGGFVLWRYRDRWGRACLFGLGYFVICLVPALGFIKHPYLLQSPVADRWQYLPLIGVAALGAAAVHRLYQRAPAPRQTLLRGAVAVVLVVFVVLTWTRSALFADAEKLNRATLTCNPQAVVIRNNLGLQLIQQGRLTDALDQLRQVVRLRPDSAEFRNNLGNLLLQLGRPQEAIPHLQAAVRLNRDFPQSRFNLGAALAARGQLDEAIRSYRAGLELAPNNGPARLKLTQLLMSGNDFAAAATQLRELLRLSPTHAELHDQLAYCLLRRGETEQAIAEFREAIRLQPRLVQAHVNLGNALALSGRAGEAIASFRRALQLDPELPGAQNNLAWLLATLNDPSLRDGTEAVQLAARAVAATGGDESPFQKTLAAAFAEAGRFADALAAIEKAMVRAAARGADQALIDELATQRRCYETGIAYREQ